jgi:hypothetical protein
MTFLRRSLAGSLLVLGFLSAGAACSGTDKGALVLAISTNMQAPKDINVVGLYITTNGVPKFNYMGRVLPDGTVSLPSTLAVVEPEEANAQVRIRLIAFQTQSSGDAKARVLRDVLTTVPHARTALLRLPLSFLDDGSAMGMLPSQYVPAGGTAPEGDTLFDVTQIASKCDWANLQQTSVNGVCTGANVDSSTLDTYEPAAVFGDGGQDNAGSGSCFDVATCFAGATPVTNLNLQSCSFAMPKGASASNLNVAIVAQGTGTCTSSGVCYVPLPNDANEGWTVQQGATVQLAAGVCTKLGATGRLAVSVGTCASQTISDAVCQPGEFVGATDAGAEDASPLQDGGTGCDGNYIVTCEPNPACAMAIGGQLPLTITGTSGVVGVPESTARPATSIPVSVDPTTCVASFNLPAMSCTPAGTVAIDTGAGTVTGLTCPATDDAGACVASTVTCTVTRGALDAGSDGGSAPDGSTVACPSGQISCAGVCTDITSDNNNCGGCGKPCSSIETCYQATCIPSGQDGGTTDSGTDAGSSYTCVPQNNCALSGYDCGWAPDGCGGIVDCTVSSCQSPAICGGAGFNLCGQSEAGTCAPTDCMTQGQQCGLGSDGCGNQIDCGGCIAPAYCGGGGFSICGLTGPTGG